MSNAADLQEGTVTQPRVYLQSAEEFMKENAHLIESAVQKEAQKQAALSPKPRKVKPAIDLEGLAAEKLANEETGSTNWIGRLLGQMNNPISCKPNIADQRLEYRSAHPIKDAGLSYNETQVGGPRFGCVALIAESPDHFGAGVFFSSKKASKQYASKKAIDWLIANKYMPADGSVRFPKVPPAAQSLPASSPPPMSKDSISSAAQVPVLCHRLGINVPTYRIVPITPGASVYDGWADFGSESVIDGKIGEVKTVFGKKQTKEQIASRTLLFLRGIEKHRREQFD